MRKLGMLAGVAIGALVLTGCTSSGDEAEGEVVTLTLESHRVDDAKAWTETIIPAFEKSHPGIKVEFLPTKATDYDAALVSKFEAGTAGDLAVCRSGEINQVNVRAGHLEPLTGLDGLDGFTELSLSYWASETDGTPYCVPMAGVSSGFFYNTAIFDELGLEEPETMGELMDVLEAIKDDGNYTPLALGATSADAWVLDRIVLSGIGQNYWKGEIGRQGLIDGSKKVTDPEFVAAFEAVEALKPYLPEGYASIAAADAKQLFILGRAAIVPSGSWDISLLSSADFEIGLFLPPVQKVGDTLYAQNHPDHGMGVNAAGKHKEEAKAFASWVASPEFAALYANALPGFFSMSSHEVSSDNALAKEFADLLATAEVSPRLGHDKLLGGGNPDFVTQMVNLLQLMMTTDTTSPKDIAQAQQEQLESWYAPQQK